MKPHHLGQLLIRLWIGHILNTGLLTPTMQSYHSFLQLLRHILSYNLQSSFLDITSDKFASLLIFVVVSCVDMFSYMITHFLYPYLFYD
jgi:hypothetical protein